MAEEIYKKNADGEEQEIDLLELATKLWNQRGKLIKWSVVGAVIGLVVAFSIPKEYSTSVKLAPEIGDNRARTRGLGALASMAGISAGMGASTDAVNPMLYPDVVSSVPFLTSLFDVEVKTKKDGQEMTVQQYMEDEIKGPWWGVVLGLPGKLIGLFRSDNGEDEEEHKLDNFQLTKSEYGLVKALESRIIASVDQKTAVVTINVKMQDALVSAIVADTVISRLQEFITGFRTDKARKDLDYALKLNEEAKVNYYNAQQEYADYLDRNHGIAFRSAQTVRERLENEAQLAFSLYNQTAQQVQRAQAKVQENTPAYAVVNPATVPMKPVSPRKFLILVGFTFLAFVACAVWILYLSPMLQEQKCKVKSDDSKPTAKKVN